MALAEDRLFDGQRDFGRVLIRRALNAHAQKRTILPGIPGWPVIGQLDLLLNDNLEADILALAEALFEILFGLERRAGPRFRQPQRHLVASSGALRMQERRELPGSQNLFVG